VVKNVAIITGVTKRKIPIYKGMNGPIVKTKIGAAAYHGTDGFGGVQQDWIHLADMENVQEEHAALGIIKHVHEESDKGHEVGLFSVGPMSNLAMAVRLDPTIVPKITYVYVMGGTVNGWGNLTLTGEYNFHADPEAAKVCIGTFQMTHLLPWETAYNFVVTREGNDFAFC
jgi:purine nucleosidase